MTAPFLNKNWDITREEINNWFVLNDFENVIHKYDNKQVGWFWRKKRYKDYLSDINFRVKFIAIEARINKFNRLSWWEKPFVYLFSGINTKRKLLSYFYANEILRDAKYYCLYQSDGPGHDVKILISKIESINLIKGMGKHLNKFVSSVLSFINRRQNIEEQSNNSSNNQVKPELAPNDILPLLFEKISGILDKLKLVNIQRWLGFQLRMTKYVFEEPSPSSLEDAWKLHPLLNSDNNYVKQVTLFYLLLYVLKPALCNYEEMLTFALNKSPYISLALDWNLFDHNKYETVEDILKLGGLGSVASILELYNLIEDVLGNLFKYYPANIQSITLKINWNGCMNGGQRVQGRIVKSLPESITSLKVTRHQFAGDIESTERYRSYEDVLSSILENLPKTIIHLDLSDASLANVYDLASILKKIPSTVQTLNICDEQLLKYDDIYLAKVFNALPKHFVSIKIIDKNMSEENKKRLDALKRNLNNRVTQNVSLKDIAVNFIYNYMKGSYDDKTKELQFHHNNKILIKPVPQEIGDLFIKEQQMSIKS